MPQTWFDYASANLPENIPDVAYDAQRQAYFEQVVRPEVIRKGGNLNDEFQAFMKSSERPGKTNWPRTQVVLSSAVQGLMSPLTGGERTPLGQDIAAGVAETTQEAERQGISTGLYRFLGENIGMAPYFATGMKGATALTRGLAGRLAGKEAVQAAAAAQEASLPASLQFKAGEAVIAEKARELGKVFFPAAIGTVQAAYDAARAPEGQALQAAWQGFGMGAGVGALFHGGLQNLGEFLFNKRGLSKLDASAIERTAVGLGGEDDAIATAKALIQTPEIEGDIAEYVTRRVQMAKSLGNPEIADLASHGNKLKIQMIGDDGKPYNIGGTKGIDPTQINDVVKRISQHLNRKGKIVSVEGDPAAIRDLRIAFDKLFAQSGAFDIPVIPHGIVEQAPGEGLVLASEGVRISELLGFSKPKTLPEKGVEPPTSPLNPENPAGVPTSPKISTPPVVEEVQAPGPPKVQRQFAFSNYKAGDGFITATFEYKGTFGKFEMPVNPKEEFGTVLIKGQEFEVTFKTRDLDGINLTLNKVMDYLDEVKAKASPAKITEEDASPLDFLIRKPNGMIFNKKTGEMFPDLRTALTASNQGVESPNLSPENGTMVRMGKGDPFSNVHDLINARNTEYHATDLEGFKGILEAGEIRPNPLLHSGMGKKAAKEAIKSGPPKWTIEEGDYWDGNKWGVKDPDGNLAYIAQDSSDHAIFKTKAEAVAWTKKYPLTGTSFGDIGVSTSRIARVSPKSDKAISFVIDSEARPKARPFAEEGYKKTVRDYSEKDEWFQKATDEEVDKYNALLMNSSDKAIEFKNQMEAKYGKPFDSSPEKRNPRFEFENRTYNQPIPLSAVKGVLVDKSALPKFSPFNPENHELLFITPEYRKWAVEQAQEAPKLRERLLNPSTYFDEEENIRLFLSNYPEAESMLKEKFIIPEIKQEAAKAGLSVKVFENSREMHAYRAGLAKQPENLRWGSGMTPAGEAPAAFGSADRPLWRREVYPFPEEMKNAEGMTAYPVNSLGQIVGKPTIHFDAEYISKPLFAHESFHALTGATGLNYHLDDLVRSSEMGRKLWNIFDTEQKITYQNEWGEEVYTFLQQAIRTNQDHILQAFVDADESYEKVMNYAVDVARDLKGKVAAMPDSIYKRTLERRLDFIEWKAGTIKDAARPIDIFGDDFSFDGEKFRVKRGEKEYVFSDRHQLAEFIDQNYSEPFSSPSVPGSEHIPPEVLRYSRKASFNPKKPPKGSVPAPTDEALGKPEGGRVSGGYQTFSFWVTPTYAWIDTVASKAKWPELYKVFAVDLKNAASKYGEDLNDYAAKIQATGIGKLSKGKREDLGEYMAARADGKDPIDVARKLNLTSDDLAIAGRLRTLYDEGYTVTGVKAPYVQDYIMRFRNPDFDVNSLRGSSRYTKEDIDFVANHKRSGEMDLESRDVLENLWTYYRLGLRWKYLGEPLKNASKMVNMRTPEGDFVLGSLQPYFKRHVELIKGNPDFSLRIVNGVAGEVINNLNKGIEFANKHLPENHQLEKMESPHDAVRKWLTFSFAGTMGLRPIVPIRDSLQVFLTSYVIFGGKYFAAGLKRAFPTLKAAMHGDVTAAPEWEIPQRYGALMHENPIYNLAAGTDRAATVGKGEKVAEAMLKPLLFSNNSNRLVSFWGHAEQVQDALLKYSGTRDIRKFNSESGTWFLDKNMKEMFNKELETLAPDKWEDFSYRVARELVDTSQWNYQRGAAPGMYKFAIGRILGQYGTWPMNYWNFVKRLLTNGEVGDRVKAGTRLVLAHSAVLSGLEAGGVDAGQWVFTQPMAYGGGPVLQAMTDLPKALDFESPQGSDARKNLQRLPFMQIPGGMQAQRLWTAIVNDDPDLFARIMGFQPMKKGEEGQGYHALIPIP